MQLAQVAQAVHGQMLGADVLLKGVTTDTRADCQDRLFIALKGENFDAHDFVEQAQMSGAGAALLEQKNDSIQIPSVLVDSSQRALSDLAAWWRAQFVLPLIAVTGSVGKTSVKEMLASIFAQLGNGLVTHGNLNNEIGVPLTLLRLDKDDQYAIIEMGMNHAGEIARLTDIAKPTIALVNNAAAAHLEGLGTVAAVAQAKGEIFQGLSTDGVAVINLDDEYSDTWLQLAKDHRVTTFGLDSAADVIASYALSTSGISLNVKAAEAEFSVEMSVLGEHNVRNALAAIAVSLAANVPPQCIIAGLNLYRPVGGRMTIHRLPTITVLDDSYNANPASMQAAIKTLSQFEGSTLIVGDMAELGAATEQAHTELGQYANRFGIQNLYACGDFSALVAAGFGDGARAFATQQALINALAEAEQIQGAVLIKGSRSARMEKVVNFLIEQYGNLIEQQGNSIVQLADNAEDQN